MWWIQIRNAIRSIGRQRGTSLINISGLTIGMASAILIFLWVQNELNFDNFHPHANRIFRIKNFLSVSKDETWVWETSPYALGIEVRKQLPEVEEVANANPFSSLYLNINGNFFQEKRAAYVDDHWFRLFHYKVLQGSVSGFQSQPNSIAITSSLAKKYFADEKVIGKIVRIDTADYQVQMVVADNPPNSSFQFDVLLSIASRLTSKEAVRNEMDWGNFNYQTYLRLAPTANEQAVKRKIQQILVANKKQDNIKVAMMPLAELHFENDLQSSTLQHADRKLVYIFALLGVLLLLIACINYVNLTTAKASLRIKEVSIRKIIGAGRGQLLIQFVLESFLISLCAMLLSTIIVGLVLPFFNRLTEKQFVLSLSDPAFWLVLGSTLFVSVVCTSVYPAVLLSSFKPLQAFRGMNVWRVKDGHLRKVLVVFQFTISIALIVSVIVVFDQLQYIYRQQQHYKGAQVVSVSVPYYALERFEESKRSGVVTGMKQSLLADAAITEVSAMNQNSVIDMQGFSSGGADWEGRHPDFNPTISYFAVDTDFNKIISIQLKEGSWFRNAADKKNVILNETAVRELNIHQPVIGQRFVGQGDTGQVIGVIKDFHYRNLHDKIGPMVIKAPDRFLSTLLIRVAPGKMAAALASIEKNWKQFLPAQPFEYNFLDEEFDRIYKADRKTATLIWIFAGLAIFISCLGLFGLSTFTAQRRIKEVGIRKVLGASVTSIVRLLSAEFMVLVLISFAIAAPLAGWAMSRWLQDFAYHIQLKWWMFLLAAGVALIITIITVSLQAGKAAVSNPVKNLRTE